MKNELLQLRDFNGNVDFQIYLQWFEDQELNRQLGPLDQEWLDSVMSESTHRQFSFWIGDQMVAVAGVAGATTDHPYWYITDIAVKPTLKRQGIGTRALKTLYHHFTNSPFQQFRCGVMKSNPLAARFMEKNGWTRLGESLNDSDDSLMWEYQILVDTHSAGVNGSKPMFIAVWL